MENLRKLLRRVISSYGPRCVTQDDQWFVWQEPYRPRRWFVNRIRCDETEVAEGFRTKREAVAYLLYRMAETPQPDEKT